MLQEFTEHHNAAPVGDPIVYRAKAILRQAIEALDKGNGYNGKGIGYTDYVPNGVQDCLRCVMEPVVRAAVSHKPDQYRDAVGYVALFMAWMADGMPESQFGPLMREHAFEFYRQLKAVDTASGVHAGDPQWMAKTDGVS
jgi:hypothetical protein